MKGALQVNLINSIKILNYQLSQKFKMIERKLNLIRMVLTVRKGVR
jgi:hypothetical protein